MPNDLETIAKLICNNKGYTFETYESSGNFKETYRVTHNGKALALKILKNGLPIERTQREIQAMLTCNHPNIGRLLDFSEYDNDGKIYTYFLEEFFKGGTLADRICGQCLKIYEIKFLGQELIAAIRHIASHGLVHRDIKPENIMFRDGEEKPILVDFGLVRDLKSTSLTQSWLMRGPGTPFYAAPEQLNNQKDYIDWRTDQFSLGVVLSLCVFNMHPYYQRGDQPEDVVIRVSEREEISKEFKKVCVSNKLNPLIKMVQEWPINRFRTTDILSNEWNKIPEG